VRWLDSALYYVIFAGKNITPYFGPVGPICSKNSSKMGSCVVYLCYVHWLELALFCSMVGVMQEFSDGEKLHVFVLHALVETNL